MKSTRKSVKLVLAFALGVLGLTVSAQVAAASHLRPQGATPVRVALAVAFERCPNNVVTSPNEQHAAPLALPSCNPPIQTSNFLTVGTGDAWPGTAANSVGRVRLDVQTTSPEDVLIKANLTDVRCNSTTAVSGFCNDANIDNASVPDYAGELQVLIPLRITDHYNDDGLGNFTESGTVSDAYFQVPTELLAMSCTSTTVSTTTPPGDQIGSDCSVVTSENGLIAGSVQDNNRANVDIPGAIQVKDGGSSGTAGAADATLFEQQGFFGP